MNNINNEPFFPNEYHYNLQDLRVKADNEITYHAFAPYLRQMNNYNKCLFIIMITAIIVILLCILIYFMLEKHPIKHKHIININISILSIISIIALGVSTIKYFSLGNEIAGNSYFKLNHTSFYLVPRDQKLHVTRVNPLKLVVTPKNNHLTSKNYDIYLHITNKQTKYSYDNFRIGKYQNHQVQLHQFSSDCNNPKLNAVNNFLVYNDYIKKHHLAKYFKDDATFVQDNTYLDKHQQPQIVMYGKNGRVLHRKYNVDQVVTLSTNK